jgi:hypothetical protein
MAVAGQLCLIYNEIGYGEVNHNFEESEESRYEITQKNVPHLPSIQFLCIKIRGLTNSCSLP